MWFSPAGNQKNAKCFLLSGLKGAAFHMQVWMLGFVEECVVAEFYILFLSWFQA